LRIAPAFGRALLTLAFVDYLESDLDTYHELAVAFLVKGPRGRGVYIHQLPVDQGFTMAAGREIWGFPKFLAEIDIGTDGRQTTCTLRHDGAQVLRLAIGDGWIPFPQPAIPTYTYLDGVLRVTDWSMHGSSRQRFGGANLTLGSGPIADQLRALGLPKGALAVSSVPSYSARFGPAEKV
ncbi:MAG: acetoacetate decarboxylase family protein, partial [Actinomycetota bacterium]